MIRDIPSIPVTAEAVADFPPQPLDDGVQHIADTEAVSIVDALPADTFLEFAARARESAADYREMAFNHPKQAAYYAKCANDREADAAWYEQQGLRKINLSEAAE